MGKVSISYAKEVQESFYDIHEAIILWDGWGL